MGSPFSVGWEEWMVPVIGDRYFVLEQVELSLVVEPVFEAVELVFLVVA